MPKLKQKQPSEPLKDRQETFAQLYSTGLYSLSEAYRLAGYSHTDADGASHRLSVKVGMKLRIAYLQAVSAEKHEVTRELLATKYDKAYHVGAATLSASGMVSAVTGTARLYGLDKQVIDHQGEDKPMTRTEQQEADEYAEFKLWQAGRGKVVPIKSAG